MVATSILDRIRNGLGRLVRTARSGPRRVAGRVRKGPRQLVPAPIRKRFSLKVGVLVLLVMVVVSVSGGVIFSLSSDAIQESTEEQLTGTTRVQAATISEWDARMKDQANFLAASDQLTREDVANIGPFLDNKLLLTPSYVRAIHVVERGTSKVLVSTASDLEGTKLSNKGVPWATRGVHALGTEAKRSRPYHDEIYDTPAITYVLQVEDRADRAVVLVVDLERRVEQLERASNESSLIIVNNTGQVVLSHNVEDINTQNIEGEGVDSPAVTAALEGKTGYLEMEMHGTTTAMGYSPVEGTNWVAMTHVEKSKASATGGLVLSSVVGMVFVSMLALAIVAVVIGRGTAADLRDLAGTARQLEEGDLEAECSTKREDELGQLYRSFDSMRMSLKSRIDEAVSSRKQAEAARQEADALNQELEAQAAAYSETMRRVAGGDLTERMDADARNESMAEIADAFNDMMADLEQVVADVADFANDVAASSEEVTASSEQVEASAQQVADSIQEITDGAERQDVKLQQVSEEMSTLSTTIEEIAASANEVADVSQRTAETGENAREAAEHAIDEMQTVESEADRTVDAMDSLQDQMDAIEEITEFITDVAEQTNILALNASIEAARAGEAGEGFAVVADEVKALAEETRQAAEDIESLVGELQDQTEVTAEEVEETSKVVGETASIVEQTVESLEQIARYAEETNVGVQEISDATSEQASSTNEAVGMVDEAASIAEQTASEASNVAGATEEQTAALSQMTDSASDLAGEADRLRDALGRFETETEASGSEVGADVLEPSAAVEPPEHTED